MALPFIIAPAQAARREPLPAPPITLGRSGCREIQWHHTKNRASPEPAPPRLYQNQSRLCRAPWREFDESLQGPPIDHLHEPAAQNIHGSAKISHQRPVQHADDSQHNHQRRIQPNNNAVELTKLRSIKQGPNIVNKLRMFGLGNGKVPNWCNKRRTVR